MANSSTVTVTLRAVADISDVLANTKQIQKAFDSLTPHLGQDLQGQFKSVFGDLEKEIAKIQSKTNKGIVDKKDIKEVEKSYNTVVRLFSKLQSLGGKITPQDLSKAFTLDPSKLKEITSNIEKLKASVANFKGGDFSGFKQLEESLKALKDAGTKNKKVVGLDISKMIGDLKSGDLSKIEEAIKLFTQLEAKTKKIEKDGKQTHVTKLGESYSSILQQLNALKTEAQSGGLQNVVGTISTLESQLQNLRADGIRDLGKAFGDTNGKVEQIKNSVSSLGAGLLDSSRQALQFNENLDRMSHRLKYFFGVENAINLVKRAVRSAYQSVTELDKAMTQTAVVTDFTVGDMWEKLPEYTKMANKLGATTQGAYETSTLYYQQGLNTAQVMSISTETMKMARIAGMEYADATNMMTAALRGFNMAINEQSATRVNDVYSELAAITAADTNQIATAMTKTASIAASANMEFETTAAFLSQIIETTQEAPETAGTALKTIIARFTEVKKLYSEGDLLGQDEEGEAIDVNKIQTALRSVGISMTEFFRGEEGLDDVLLRLAEKWDTLDLTTQRYIATTAAGSRQQSRFLAMMSDYDRTMELVEAANNSAGSSQEQFDKTLESLESKVNQLKNAWQAFTMSLADDGLVKGAVDSLTALLNAVNSLTDAFGKGSGISKLLLGAGLFKLGTGVIGGVRQYATDLHAGVGTGSSFAMGMSKAMGWGALAQGQGLWQAARSSSKWRGGGALGLIPFSSGWNASTQTRFNDYLGADLAGKYQNLQVAENQAQQSYNTVSKMIEAEEEDATPQEFSRLQSEKDQARRAQERATRERAKFEEENKDKISGAKAQAQVDNYQKMGQAVTVLAGAFALLGNAADKAGLDGLAEVFNGIATAAGIAGPLLMALPPIITAIAGSAQAAQAAMGPIAIALAAIAAGFVLFKVISASVETAAEKVARLKEEAETAKTAADEASSAYQNLLSGYSAHDTLLEELNNLIEGTDAFKRKLEEANAQAYELISTYSMVRGIDYEVNDGVVTFTTEGRKKQAESLEQASKQQREYAEYKAALSDYEEAQFNFFGEGSWFKRREVKDYDEYGTTVGGKETLTNAAAFQELIKNESVRQGLDKFLGNQNAANRQVAERAIQEFINSPEASQDLKNWYTSFSSSGLQLNLSHFIKDVGKLGEGEFQTTADIAQAMSEVSQTGGRLVKEIVSDSIDTSSIGYQIFEDEIVQAVNGVTELTEEQDKELAKNFGQSKYKGLSKEDAAKMLYQEEGIYVNPESFDNTEKMYEYAQDLRLAERKKEATEGLSDDVQGANDWYKKLTEGKTFEDIMNEIKSPSQTYSYEGTDVSQQIGTYVLEQVRNMRDLGVDEGLIYSLTEGRAKAIQNLVGPMSQTFEEESKYIANLLAQERMGQEDYDFLSSISWTGNAFENVRQLQQEALIQGQGKFQPIVDAFADSLDSGDIVRSLLNSESFSEAHSKLIETFKAQGEITANDVQELSKEYDILNDALELGEINAQGLATTLEMVARGDVGLDALTGSLAEANSLAGEFESRLARAYSYIDEFDPGRSEKDLGEFAKTGADTIIGAIDEGRWFDTQLESYYKAFFGEKGWSRYEGVMRQAAEQELSGVEIQKLLASEQGIQSELLALQSFQTRGNLSGYWEYLSAQDGFEKSIATIGEGGIVDIGDDTTLAQLTGMLSTLGVSESMQDMLIGELAAYSSGQWAESWRAEGVLAGRQAFIDAEKAGTESDYRAYYKDNEEVLRQQGYKTEDDFVQGIKKERSDADKVMASSADVESKNLLNSLAENGFKWAEEFGIRAGEKGGLEYYLKSFNLKDSIKELEKYGVTGDKALDAIKQKAEESGKAFEYMGQEINLGAVDSFSDLESEMKRIENEAFAEQIGQAVASSFQNIDTSVDTTGAAKDLQKLFDNFSNLSITAAITATPSTVTIDVAAMASGKKGASPFQIPGFARGKNNYQGPALTGEEGPELVWGKHGMYLTGLGGPEFQYIYRDDAVYTAKETQEILKQMGVPGYQPGKPGLGYSSGLGSVLDFLSGTGSGGGSKKGGDWDNPYDELYNLTEKINEALRDREKLEREYDKLLKDRNASFTDLIANTLNSMAKLRQEIALQQELQAGRARQLQNIGSYTFRDKDKKEKTFQEAGVMQYASYDSSTGVITIDWEGIEAVTDENQGAAIEAYISKLEELVEQYEETEETIADMEDTLEEIRDRGKEQYLEFEDRIYEALVEREQKLIDEYEDVSNTINDSNSRILDGLRESIDLSRQIRDNTKTEEEIADKEARLAYLRRDTSGANQLEIQQLEEELKEMRESYQDTLIDQELDRLNQVNEMANEQRERQIEIANAQLEWLKDSGAFWEETQQLIRNAIDGGDISNSNLAELLRSDENFKALSEFGQYNWITELVTEFNEAQQGLSNWRLDRAKEAGIIEETSVGKLTYDKNTGKWTNEEGQEYTAAWNTETRSWDVKEVYNEKVPTSAEGDGVRKDDGDGTEEPKVKYFAPTVGGKRYAGSYGLQRDAQAAADNYLAQHRNSANSYLTQARKLWETTRTTAAYDALQQALESARYWQQAKASTMPIYKTGGLNTQTGPAWLDGTPSRPEYVLNANQTAAFLQLAEVLPSIMSSGSVSTSTSGDNYFDININVDSISSDYDVDRLTERIKQNIYEDGAYRNVNVINRLR